MTRCNHPHHTGNGSGLVLVACAVLGLVILWQSATDCPPGQTPVIDIADSLMPMCVVEGDDGP